MIALFLMAAAVSPLAELSRDAEPICRALVRASDRGADPAELAQALHDLGGYGSDGIKIFCAGYLAGVVDERRAK